MRIAQIIASRQTILMAIKFLQLWKTATSDNKVVEKFKMRCLSVLKHGILRALVKNVTNQQNKRKLGEISYSHRNLWLKRMAMAQCLELLRKAKDRKEFISFKLGLARK